MPELKNKEAAAMRLYAIQQIAKRFQNEVSAITSSPPGNPSKFAEGYIELVDGRRFKITIEQTSK